MSQSCPPRHAEKWLLSRILPTQLSPTPITQSVLWHNTWNFTWTWRNSHIKNTTIFGIVPDGTLQQLKEALPHLQINCSHFTTSPRPAFGNKENQEIRGTKSWLTGEAQLSVKPLLQDGISSLLWTGRGGRKPSCRELSYFYSWFSIAFLLQVYWRTTGKTKL